jgi:MFS family permease
MQGQAGMMSETSERPDLVRIIILATLINAIDGMDVMIMSYVAPSLARDWSVVLQALGAVFSIGLAGMMIGSIFLAPFADRFGRRPIILAGLAIVSAGTIGTGLAPGLFPFMAFRALTGIGIGALLATVGALVSDAAPEERRSIAVGWFQAGYPIGAVATGIVSLWSIPHFGWQETLLGAGCLNLVLFILCWNILPESPEVGRKRSKGLPRIAPLIADGRWRASASLWAATGLSYAVLYFVTSWIPKLAMEAGLGESGAIWAGSIFNIGGAFGGLAIGALAVRRPVSGLILRFFIACAALLIIFSLPLPLPLVLLTAALLGFSLQGGFSGFYALCAEIYPPAVRGAGIGWAVGIGRLGSIVGPMAGGFLLGAKVALWLVFACFAIPLIIAGLFAVLAQRISRRASA